MRTATSTSPASAGWDPQVLVAQRIRFLGNSGDVIGVVGKKPIHLMKSEDRDKASKMTDLWVDIGAASRAEASARLSVGDAGVIDSKSVAAAERSHRLAIGGRPHRRVRGARGAAALQREAGQGEGGCGGDDAGGDRVAWRRRGRVRIVHWRADGDRRRRHLCHRSSRRSKRRSSASTRSAAVPVLTRGSIISPVVFRMLRGAADELKMPYTLQAAGRDTSTDADAIHVAAQGIATALVSVPEPLHALAERAREPRGCRSCRELIAEACRRVDEKTDFTAR